MHNNTCESSNITIIKDSTVIVLNPGNLLGTLIGAAKKLFSKN